MSVVSIGIDMSLNSPGLCRIVTSMTLVKQQQIDFYYWPQRVRYKVNHNSMSSIKDGGHIADINIVNKYITIHRFRHLPIERHLKMSRIVNDIMYIVSKNDVAPPSAINIEGYAYAIRNSSSLTVLAEICGHLKCTLRNSGYCWNEISPNKLKKSFTGNGNAKKMDMINKWETMYPHLNTHLQCLRHKSPYNDLIDAYALANF